MKNDTNFIEDVCVTHGSRMHRKDKKRFREYLINQAKSMGYQVSEEKGAFGTNVVVGNPDNATTVCTAHYDTPPRLPKFVVKHMILSSFVLFPMIILGVSIGLPQLLINKISTFAFDIFYLALNIVQSAVLVGCVAYLMGCFGGANKNNYNDNSSGCITLLKLMKKYENAPKNVKEKVSFVFFDNEEKGLLGSKMFSNKHKKYLKNQTFMNFDCVGRGNQFNMYYYGKEKTPIVKEIENLQMEKGYKAKAIKSTMMSMSDHLSFKKYNHICFLSVDQNNNKSIYTQIHSSNDTKIDAENIDVLCNTITKTTAFDFGEYDNIENQKQLEKQDKLVSDKNLFISRILKNKLQKKDTNTMSDEFNEINIM